MLNAGIENTANWITCGTSIEEIMSNSHGARNFRYFKVAGEDAIPGIVIVVRAIIEAIGAVRGISVDAIQDEARLFAIFA